MNQTTLGALQILLQHLRERRQPLDLDRRLGLCARGHHQKTTAERGVPLHHPIDLEPDHL